MRTTAANVAARAAVGGDDMLSKWQLMAEQARQKREGGPDVPSGSQGSKDSGGSKATSVSNRSAKDHQDSGKRGQGSLSSSGMSLHAMLLCVIIWSIEPILSLI